MPKTIYLQIGNKDRVSLSVFIESLRNFLRMLQDLDATISHDKRGSLTWEVVFLQKKSPPLVGVMPLPRRELMDVSDAVEVQLLENTRLLTYSTDRNQYFSDSALGRLEKLAKKSKRLGPFSIYIGEEGQERTESLISESTLRNVQQLTGISFSGYGSIIGNLDAITVHNADEFRVWDENTSKPIRCKFPRTMEDQVKSLLRSRVTVVGTVSSNSAGNPISVKVEELKSAVRGQLPTIQEMSGLVEDFTDGKPLKKYLEDQGDE